MKKKFFLIVKTFLFLFCIFISILNSTNYPGNGTDLPIGIYSDSKIFRGGDEIGVLNTAEISTATGLVWLTGGLCVVSGGAGNYVAISTPLPVVGEIGLITGGDDFPVLVSDLFLSNKVTLTVGGEFQTKYGRIVLDGEFDLSDQTLSFDSAAWPGKINGNGNVLNFSNGGTLRHVDGSIELENVYLKGVSTTSFIFTNRTSDFILNNCIIQLDGDFVADCDLDIYGDVFVTGSGHTLCPNGYLKINKGARLIMDVGTTFSMGYPASITQETEGIIHFNGCNIDIGDNYGLAVNVSDGFFMRNGLVVFENRVKINDDSNGKTFTVGEGCDVKVLGGARIILDGTTTFSVL